MATIDSAVDQRSAEFRANREAMEPLVADLRSKLAGAALGGGDSARSRHLAPRQAAAARSG